MRLDKIFLTKKKIWKLAIFLIVAFLFFYWLPYARESWTEDVRLHDGRTIEVSRTSKRIRFSEPGHLGPIIHETITFEINGEKVTWEGESQALSFDIFNDAAYVVAEQKGSQPHCQGGKSNFQYYKLDHTWVGVEPTELPDSTRINLLFDTWRPNSQRHYTLRDKEITDFHPTHPYFIKPLKALC